MRAGVSGLRYRELFLMELVSPDYDRRCMPRLSVSEESGSVSNYRPLILSLGCW
jgi:hypothetical protein